jgi:glycosyltransferase involved in cell wall biosynthesis
MKVLILNSLYRPHAIGGAERSVEILTAGLRDKGMEPVIVSTADSDSIDQVDGIKTYYLKIPNLYWTRTAKTQPAVKKPFWHLLDSYNPLVSRPLTRIIESEKPRIFHSNNLAGFSVFAWKVAAKFKLPIVHTIRDHYLLCPNSVMYRSDRRCPGQCLRCRFYSVPRKKLSKFVHAAVGVSRFILDKHLNSGYFKASKIKTHIYSPAFLDSNPRKSNRDRSYVTFGFVGMLAPIKGIEYLLKRYGKMRSGDAKLKVFGRGITPSFEKYLIDRYAGDYIEFMGFKNPDEIYHDLDAVIIPSLCDDAFPRVLIESYSHGVPVIATCRGGAPEMIDEGKTGLIFDPSVDGDLENKINQFVNNRELPGHMVNRCLEAAEEFSPAKTIDKITQIYDRISANSLVGGSL